MRAYAVLLGVLSLAFAGRVAGQLLVAVYGFESLPPIEAWYSGLVPYPALLAAQLAILACQVEISRELWVGAGPVSTTRPVFGRALAWFSLVYFPTMVARYLITSVGLPGGSRFGDTIPIVFHWILASYLWILSRRVRGLPFFGQS